MKVLFIDTETTGLDPKVHDIIQLAGLIEIDGEIKEDFVLEIEPTNYESIDPKALAVNGYTLEQLKTFMSLREAHEEFLDYLDLYVDKYNPDDKFYVGGYNVAFDIAFLSSMFAKCKDPYLGSYINYRVVDPFPVLHFMDYKGKIKLPNYKLATVCEHYKVPIVAHNAIEDIKATRQLINLINI